VVRGKNDELPRTEGRHNTMNLVSYFASTNYPFAPSDICFKNCVFENILSPLKYTADRGTLQSGTHLGRFVLENVKFTDIKEPSTIIGSAEEPLTVVLKNVTAEFADSATCKELFVLNENSFTTIISE
jgi:hypothetical protein